MPGPSNPAAVSGDGIDDLFDYDVDVDELFKSFEDKAGSQAKKKGQSAKWQPPKGQGSKTKSGDLGIDEEIRIAKKRLPVAKLDEERLLSQKGLPKLRRIAKERLRFKGKGHEFKDVRKMLNMYQLWLDDLYPRAKFMDGAAMIEKLGHSKRMQVMRKEWIAESRNTKFGNPMDEFKYKQYNGVARRPKVKEPQVRATSNLQGSTTLAAPESVASNSKDSNGEAPEDGEDTLFLPNEERQPASILPPDDELDALLAEDYSKSKGKQKVQLNSIASSAIATPTNQRQTDEFADEMEAMAEMDGIW